MANPQVIDGTSEQLRLLLDSGAFAGQRLRLIVDPEREDAAPNVAVPPGAITDVSHVEELLLAGIRSGDADEMTASDWEELHSRLRSAVQRRAKVS
jgi:hypothetical protein